MDEKEGIYTTLPARDLDLLKLYWLHAKLGCLSDKLSTEVCNE
jgi:hypothetical protein